MVALLLLLAFPSGPYVADDYTILLLHFDEGRGEIARDLSPFRNHCRIVGARWAEGKFGGALDFREGGVAVVPFHPSLQVSEEFTIEAWVWVEGPSDEIQRIAFRSGVYGFYLNPKGTNLVFFVNAGGKWESVVAPVPTRKWVHLAGVYDGREMRLYIDGELKARRRKAGTVVESVVPLLIGANDDAGRWQLRGMVDEIRLSCIARERFDPREVLRFEPTTELRPLPPESVSVEVFLPRMKVGRCPKSPVIDGDLSDPAWRRSARGVLIHPPPGREVTQKTLVYVTYDDRRLYIAFRCREARMREIVAEQRGRDSPVWMDDCVEVFLMPRPKTGVYYHLAVNPLGTLYDARHGRRGRDPSWDSGAEVAVRRGKEGWEVELAVPFEALGVGAPKVGDTWRANFCREERPHGELSAWSPVGKSFHRPERFGYLEFGLRPEVQPEEWATIKGMVRDVRGRRLEGVKVATSGGVVRTDGSGYFKVRMRRGRGVILIADP
ncbi:MAG TPA: hypothetical protein EYP65_01895, partial [Armatimonadetes bacterium]|nr:hypothetical protein [Armatimonadota bacterium]